MKQPISKYFTLPLLIILLLSLAWFLWSLKISASFPSNLADFRQLLSASEAETKYGEVLSVPPTARPSVYDSHGAEVSLRLKNAEVNWNRSYKRQNIAVKKLEIENAFEFPDKQARIFWDFFYPTFDCPFTKERIGRIGDGGKWICGFDLLVTKVNCIVFSFGVGGETTFEKEILRRTDNCIVHMFDPTISAEPAIVAEYPSRAFFHFQGVGAQDSGNIGTLKSIMAELKVNDLDVVKMDAEGAEWGSMSRIIEDFPQGLPFAQLQIEVHLGSFTNASERFKFFDTWYRKLQISGLRQFFQEPNLLNEERFMYRELAFLNTKVHPFQLA